MFSARIAKRLVLHIALLSTFSGAAYAEHRSINRTLSVKAGDLADVYTSINGEVQLAEFAKANEVSTINGSLTLHGHNQVQSLSSVNGPIRAADSVVVKSTVRSVNGDIRLGAGLDAKAITTVHGRLELAGGKAEKLKSVTGAISIQNTQVAQGVETVWGDITVSQSRIGTRIRVIKPRSSFGPLASAKRAPRLIIGEGCEIVGGIDLEHPTQVFVHTNAALPKINGSLLGHVERFDGLAPKR